MERSGSTLERTRDDLAMGAAPLAAPADPPSTSPSARRLVVVPREPGPIVAVEVGATRPPDDLDLLVDEILGPPPADRPGVADLVLVGLGVAGLAWVLILGGPPWVAAVAVIAIILGLAIPIRSLLGRSRNAGTALRVRSARRRGWILDVTDGSTAGLVTAHGRLRDAAAASGSVYADRACDAGHAAVVEVATLLDGAPPDGDGQRAYVGKRTAAIDELAGLLEEAGRRSAAAALASAQAQEARRRRWVDAVASARDELQAEDRQGSLARIERVTRRLEREQDDADA